MPKQMQQDEEIYLAPGILGKYENGSPVVRYKDNGDEQLDPAKFSDKITIYEREVKGWFLDPADKLLKDDLPASEIFTNSFIVMMICMSYFEGVEQYKTGTSSKDKSSVYFVNSVKRLYPDKDFKDNDLKELYKNIRCGLFHTGMVKGAVLFNNYDFPDAIKFESAGKGKGPKIKINPKKLLEDINNDFNRYLTELRSSNFDDANRRLGTLAESFDNMFSVLPKG